MLLSILFIFIIIMFFTLFLLPYDIGIRLEKVNESIEYIIFIRSWQSIMGIEWRKENDMKTIHFKMFKIVFRKKVRPQQSIQNKQVNKQSSFQKKNKFKKWCTCCVVANTAIDSPRWLLRLIRMFHLKTFEIRGYCGLHDPACTGVVYGLIQALYLFNWSCVHLSIIPYFYGRKYDGSIHLEFQLLFFQLLGYLLHAGIRFLWILGRCRFKMKGRLAW